MSLINEVAVHQYLEPVIISLLSSADGQLFDGVVDLFEGRIINKPEITLEGQIGRRGRCEYTYTYFEASMLLLIELKFDLSALSDEKRSDIIGQIAAEADGTVPLYLLSVTVRCVDV